MFLIGNLLISCLEWDYPVDSSSLPADLQWISFVLEGTLWKKLNLAAKCAGLYIIITVFSRAMRLSLKPQTTLK